MIAANILITIVVGGALSYLTWKLSPAAWSGFELLGLCLMAIGFVLWTTARFQLGKSLAVTAKAKNLVTRGLYSRIRNPIYVFGSCTVAGLILTVGRPKWFLFFLIIIPLQLWRAGKEAKVLEAKFGEEYRVYRTGTWF